MAYDTSSASTAVSLLRLRDLPDSSVVAASDEGEGGRKRRSAPLVEDPLDKCNFAHRSRERDAVDHVLRCQKTVVYGYTLDAAFMSEAECEDVTGEHKEGVRYWTGEAVGENSSAPMAVYTIGRIRVVLVLYAGRHEYIMGGMYKARAEVLVAWTDPFPCTTGVADRHLRTDTTRRNFVLECLELRLPKLRREHVWLKDLGRLDNGKAIISSSPSGVMLAVGLHENCLEHTPIKGRPNEMFTDFMWEPSMLHKYEPWYDRQHYQDHANRCNYCNFAAFDFNVACSGQGDLTTQRGVRDGDFARMLMPRGHLGERPELYLFTVGTSVVGYFFASDAYVKQDTMYGAFKGTIYVTERVEQWEDDGQFIVDPYAMADRLCTAVQNQLGPYGVKAADVYVVPKVQSRSEILQHNVLRSTLYYSKPGMGYLTGWAFFMCERGEGANCNLPHEHESEEDDDDDDREGEGDDDQPERKKSYGGGGAACSSQAATIAAIASSADGVSPSLPVQARQKTWTLLIEPIAPRQPSAHGDESKPVVRPYAGDQETPVLPTLDELFNASTSPSA
jgi:hypothetical protein